MPAQSALTFARLLPLLALSFVVGCETTAVSRRPELTEPFAVTRDMPGEEIIAHLGEPDLRHPLHDYSVDAEVWVYNRTLASKSRMVLTGIQPTRLWDPVSRSTVTVDMPVYQPEKSATVEVSEILLIRGRVLSWKRKTINDRAVDGVPR